MRLGRFAVAPDGALWFAELTGSSVTRLKDEKFVRHAVDPRRGGPYGVAVAADGTVWATLQTGNRLLRNKGNGAKIHAAIERYKTKKEGEAEAQYTKDHPAPEEAK